MQLWEERVRRDIQAARRESSPILIDTLPGFLEALAHALDANHPRTTASEGNSIPIEHGGERARLTQYRPEDLIREYQLLREVILEVLEEDGPLSEEERRTILLSLDGALAASATSFFLVQQGIRQQFAATLTHDLRGPLTAARASASLILRKADQPEVLTWAARIVDSMDRADRMIRDLLDVTSLRAGERPALPMAEGDLVSVARDAVAHLQAEHGDRFLLVAPPTLPGWFSAEALRRAIENLGSNAVKYGGTEKPVTISLREFGGRAMISVHNFGSYIPPEDRELLFEAFRRTTQARRSGERGWGLGLTLVRGVAESHGGSIGVNSLPERGTTFVIDIPLDARPFQNAPLSG